MPTPSMDLVSLLLPIAVLVGFVGLAIGGTIARVAVIVAAILAGVDVLYLLIH